MLVARGRGVVNADDICILLLRCKSSDKFDYIIVETTGMANPGAVASIFWLDEEMNSSVRAQTSPVLHAHILRVMPITAVGISEERNGTGSVCLVALLCVRGCRHRSFWTPLSRWWTRSTSPRSWQTAGPPVLHLFSLPLQCSLARSLEQGCA